MTSDEAEIDEAAAYRQDDLEAALLVQIEKMLKGVPGLVKIGPIGKNYTCPVAFESNDARLKADLPKTLNFDGEDRAWDIMLVPTVEQPTVPFSPELEAMAAPTPPSGPLMGGDAIWLSSRPADFGTLAFVANTLTVSHMPAGGGNRPTLRRDACLSCQHVLAKDNAVPPAPISTVRYQDAFALAESLPTNVVDAAVGERLTNPDIAFCTVRGLGRIRGVERPSQGMRVFKYGARTGLTTGVTGQLVSVQTAAGIFFRVFQVPYRFACVHDSGAAVLNRARKLVGLVFRGSSADCNIAQTTYYLPASPLRGGEVRNQNAIYVEFT